MSPDHRISTARTRLRPIEKGDLDAVHQLWTDPDVRRYLWDDEVIPQQLAALLRRAPGYATGR